MWARVVMLRSSPWHGGSWLREVFQDQGPHKVPVTMLKSHHADGVQ